AACVPKLPQARGRAVIKSDYEAELQAARAKAQTPAYAQVRREHPAIERKLGEMVRRHGARRARYWGRPRVLLQQLLTGWVVNIKRLVKLLVDPPGGDAGTVRAAALLLRVAATLHTRSARSPAPSAGRSPPAAAASIRSGSSRSPRCSPGTAPTAATPPRTRPGSGARTAPASRRPGRAPGPR